VHGAVTALLDRRSTIEVETWRSLWDQLDAGALDQAQSVALLASLATALPDQATLCNLFVSLRERRPEPPEPWPDSVNIVGTGGGPKTVNISTAAALVAATIGVRVVKTGSRAYTSSLGSIDLLERLGVRLTNGYEQTGETLERFGVAFAGGFVYPAALTRLARRVLPLSMKPFGRFLNAMGPFLAAVPVSAQVTGVSSLAPLAEMQVLAESTERRTIWLCTNEAGADELLPFADNVIHTPRGAVRLTRGSLIAGDGSLDALRPVAEPTAAVAQFLDLLSGRANDVATRTVCLNAAALAVVSGHQPNWSVAVGTAEEALRDGAVIGLLERLRAHRPNRTTVVRMVAGG
jgi:anthranilate phosphoribosyltransferase